MAAFIKGDVVVIPFPFSDLTGSKFRPAFVVKDLPGSDLILCQITSIARTDSFAVPLAAKDFISGSLPSTSYVRPSKIFTADKTLIRYTAGHLCETKIADVISALVSLVQH